MSQVALWVEAVRKISTINGTVLLVRGIMKLFYLSLQHLGRRGRALVEEQFDLKEQILTTAERLGESC